VQNLRSSESTYFLDFKPSDAYTLFDAWDLVAFTSIEVSFL